MTHQLSVPFDEKLDQPLAELCNRQQLASSALVPVVIRCAPAEAPGIIAAVQRAGGKVRRQVDFVGAIAAWLPLFAVAELSRLTAVRRLELEQQFTIA